MNKAVLDQYNLTISKKSNGQCDITGHWLATYIYIFRVADNVQGFIDDIDLAINNQYSSIEDPDYTAGYSAGPHFTFYGLITETGFEVWEVANPSGKMIIPLNDMKEILVSWLSCLKAK